MLDAYLFGSQATGHAQPHSDIDVAVYIDESRAPRPAFGHAAELTTLLMSALGTNAVDLRVVEDILHNHLRDFVAFVDAIDRWLQTSRTGPSR